MLKLKTNGYLLVEKIHVALFMVSSIVKCHDYLLLLLSYWHIQQERERYYKHKEYTLIF